MISLPRDSAIICAAFAVSLVLGYLTNALRPDRMMIPYENPQARVVRAMSPTTVSRILEPAVIEYKQAHVAWKDGKTLFVDARIPDYYQTGHIPGAINLPRMTALEGKIPSALSDLDKPLVVYCTGQDCEDSKAVAMGLSAMGHTHISVYEGGWEEWSLSGSPIEK